MDGQPLRSDLDFPALIGDDADGGRAREHALTLLADATTDADARAESPSQEAICSGYVRIACGGFSRRIQLE
jgi:hypothetical protein